MEFKQGTTVYTARGEDVGRIDRVVLDPTTKEVTHIVVQKGFLFTEDKIVPLNLIASATEDRITLRSDAGDLKQLPPFEETHYIPLDEMETRNARYPRNMAAPVYWYPPVGGWMGYSGYGYAYPPPYVAETERHAPARTVALEESSNVYSSDGKHVGDVERIFTESNADRATHFLISQGLFFKDHKLVPISWVKQIRENEVHLSVSADTLDALHDYQEA